MCWEKVIGLGGTESELVLPYISHVRMRQSSTNRVSVHYFAVFWCICISC